MKKSVMSLNLLWAAVAAGTFYAGSLWREEHSGGPAGTSRPVVAQPGTSGPLANRAAKSDTGEDAEIDAFVERFGLHGKVPLSSDMMSRAISEAMRETDPIKSQLLFGRLMSALTPENAAAALAMIRENAVGFESMRYMSMFSYAWGGVDPAAAMKAMEGTGDRGDRGGRMFQGTALTGWAAKDPAAAMAWLESYKGEDKQGLTQSLVSGLAKSDFAAALKYAGALENNGEKARAAQTLAREMIRSGGVEGATSWLASLTDPAMKASAFDTVAQQLLRSNPEQAADFIRKNAGQDYAAGAAASLAASLSRRDVQKGLEFAGTLTGNAQNRAYGEVIEQWMERENGAGAPEASDYVNKMPPGPARDAGAAIIAREVSREDPAASIAWASTISDAAQREQLLVQAGRRYLRSDPQAGTAWLAQSGLSPAAQQQITAPREERGNNSEAGGGPPGGGFQRGGFPGGGRRGADGGGNNDGGRRGR